MNLYVLTLPDARQRQARVRGWLDGEGSTSTDAFVPGVDLRGPGVVFDAPINGRQLRLQRYGRPDLAPPEYGCLLGHRRIWERLIAEGHPWALVLEDDARPLTADWSERVEALVAQLANSLLRESAWVVHLSLVPTEFGPVCLRPVCWRRVAAGVPAVGQVDPSIRKVWTTLAYLISREAAQRLLEAEQDLPWMADDWTMRLRSGALPCLLATWEPVFGGYADFPTQIEQRVGFRPKPLWYKVAFRLAWPLNRIKHWGYRHGWWPVRY